MAPLPRPALPRRRRWLFLSVATALVGSTAGVARAGLPGYFEWVLWKETQTLGAGATAEPDLEWMVGPYAKLLTCEEDRDRLTERAATGQPGTFRRLAPGVVVVRGPTAIVRIQLLCIPDSVNPRQDRRWR